MRAAGKFRVASCFLFAGSVLFSFVLFMGSLLQQKWQPIDQCARRGGAWKELCGKRMSLPVDSQEFGQRMSLPVDLEQRATGDGMALLQNITEALGALPEDLAQARADFQDIANYDAWDLLAFRETWTDADTEFLKMLNCNPNSWVEGALTLTTDAFAARLPSIKDLSALVREKRIAIVGNGPVSVGQGQRIDAHPLVARFNHHVGSTLNRDSGSNTDIHVINAWVKGLASARMQFDLEANHLDVSYCLRIRRHGAFYQPSSEHRVLLFRPSVTCGLTGLSRFTRGFLFYWFVGRLFESADLYFMTEDDNGTHFDGVGRIWESNFPFEHLLLRFASRMQT